jgi:hypothetical protein
MQGTGVRKTSDTKLISQFQPILRNSTFQLWRLDWELGDFLEWIYMGNWKSFGFSNFDHSNLLGKKLAIGQLLGKWEIFGQLENPILSNLPKPHGNRALENL